MSKEAPGLEVRVPTVDNPTTPQPRVGAQLMLLAAIYGSARLWSAYAFANSAPNRRIWTE